MQNSNREFVANRHAIIDQGSPAFGRLIAAKVGHQPELIERARRTLDRWMQTVSEGSRPTLTEWARVLDGPVQRVLDVLTGEDERSTRFGQSSPFAGVLSQPGRNAIVKQDANHDPAAT